MLNGLHTHTHTQFNVPWNGILINMSNSIVIIQWTLGQQIQYRDQVMDWKIQVSSPGRCNIISLSLKCPDWLLGPTQPPIQRLSGVEQQRHEAHHLVPFSATRPVCLQSTGCTFTFYYLSVLFSYLYGNVQHKAILAHVNFNHF